MSKMISVESLSLISKIFKDISSEISDVLNDIKTPITNNELYKLLEFPRIPKIFPYRKNELIINRHNFLDGGSTYQLLIDSSRWMTFNSNNYDTLFEVYSHYNLSKGHCICTGLGFGLREKWLLSKKEVSKITILEKNIEVINYHKELNPDLMSQIEVIHCDASEYNGKCDTLLLDHYELEPLFDRDNYFQNIKRCCSNIDHSVLWFWPLELIVTNSLTNKDKNFSKKRYENYLSLVKIYPTLPNINEHKLNSYCDIFYLPNLIKFSSL